MSRNHHPSQIFCCIENLIIPKKNSQKISRVRGGCPPKPFAHMSRVGSTYGVPVIDLWVPPSSPWLVQPEGVQVLQLGEKNNQFHPPKKNEKKHVPRKKSSFVPRIEFCLAFRNNFFVTPRSIIPVKFIHIIKPTRFFVLLRHGVFKVVTHSP